DLGVKQEPRAQAVDEAADKLLVNGDSIVVTRQNSLEKLPWSDLEIDLVMECSGSFSDRKSAAIHLQRGADAVLFSQPGDSDVDATIVYGINHQTLTPDHQVVSNASCTTNCIVPVLHALHETLHIESGVITTIHSAMNDQPVIDSFHNTDLRKTRSAMQSMIPVETQLAKGIERILPALSGKLQAQAIRVPTLNVSAMDLAVNVRDASEASQVNEIIKSCSEQFPDNVLGYTSEPLASIDFNHDPRSAIVDLTQTRVANGKLVKLLVWFDNEWAYANRMLDVAQYMAALRSR
ncbi:MAG: glyceraldehyde 3-phosphate dehydrogenase NAD-binding domain-containing protein, partial [Gimesia chilikensis]